MVKKKYWDDKEASNMMNKARIEELLEIGSRINMVYDAIGFGHPQSAKALLDSMLSKRIKEITEGEKLHN